MATSTESSAGQRLEVADRLVAKPVRSPVRFSWGMLLTYVLLGMAGLGLLGSAWTLGAVLSLPHESAAYEQRVPAGPPRKSLSTVPIWPASSTASLTRYSKRPAAHATASCSASRPAAYRWPGAWPPGSRRSRAS